MNEDYGRLHEETLTILSAFAIRTSFKDSEEMYASTLEQQISINSFIYNEFIRLHLEFVTYPKVLSKSIFSFSSSC